MTISLWMLIFCCSLVFIFYQVLQVLLFDVSDKKMLKSIQGKRQFGDPDFIAVENKEKLNAKQQTGMLVLGVLGLIGFAGGFFTGVILTLVLAACGYYYPLFILKKKIKNRKDAFQSQILDMLETVSNGLKAGLSFPQSLESAVNQLPPPMSQELEMVLRQNSLGVNLDDALIQMSDRVKNENLNLVVSAITVTRQLGGNLPEIFSIISETIRDRETMEGKISALTSQGRMQAMVMGFMPFFLGLGIFLLDKKTIMPLFINPIGWGMLLLVVILNVIGFVMIRKIVDIEI